MGGFCPSGELHWEGSAPAACAGNGGQDEEDLYILPAPDVLKKYKKCQKRQKVSDFLNGEALSGVQTLIFLGQNSEIRSALDLFLCGGVAYIIADF